MKPQKIIPNKLPSFILSSAAMELCWMTAWAVHCTLLVTHSAFPIPMAMVAFFFSAGLTLGLDKIPRIRRHLFFIHAIGFLTTVTVVWWISRYAWPMDFTRGWQMGLRKGILLTQPGPDAQWPILFFSATWILLFGLAGIAWSRRSHTHQSVCNRFDLGASLLFLLFIMKLLLSKRFDIPVEASSSIYLLALFFLFGLFSIGCAKNHDSRSSYDAEGPRSGGILPIFVIVVVLFSISSISFMRSHLQIAAQLAYDAIKVLTGPLASMFSELLIFIFKASPDTADGMRRNMDAAPNGSPPVESLISQNDLFMHGAGLFYGIMFILSFACAIGLIYRWMTVPNTPNAMTRGFPFVGWISRRLKRGMDILVQIIRGMRPKKGVGFFYTALIKWGKRSGVAHRANETPREFASRLAQRFPEVGGVAVDIAEHYNACVYGARPSNEVTLIKLHKARRKLRSPRLWPVRMKAWVVRR